MFLLFLLFAWSLVLLLVVIVIKMIMTYPAAFLHVIPIPPQWVQLFDVKIEINPVTDCDPAPNLCVLVLWLCPWEGAIL